MSYKNCNVCGHAWDSRAAFLGDPLIELIGYQVSFEDLKAGYFLFNHTVRGCGTTLAVPAGDFFDLYEGPIFEERLTGTQNCPGFCLNKGNMERCPERCECAYVREVLQVVLAWPKEYVA